MVDTACVFAFVAEHSGVIFHPAKHHFRVFHKVRVDCDTVLSPAKMHPVRLCNDFVFPLL